MATSDRELQRKKRQTQVELPIKEFVASSALARVVVDGFTETPSSDYEIICHERVFHVHTLVLCEVPFFKAMIQGGWSESTTRVLHSTTKASAMEAVLAHIYGAKISFISACLLRGAGCTTTYKKSFEVYSSLNTNHNSTAACFGPVRMDGTGPIFLRDPTPQESEQMVIELLGLIDVLIAADYYCLDDLASAIGVQFSNVLDDAWTDVGIFRVAIAVHLSNLSEKWIFLQGFNYGFVDRLEIYGQEPEFATLCAAYPGWTAEVFELMRCVPESDSLIKKTYCPRFCCRDNTKTITTRGYPRKVSSYTCGECGGTGLPGRRRTKLAWASTTEEH